MIKLLIMFLLTITSQTSTIELEIPTIVGQPRTLDIYRLTYYHDGDDYGSGKCTASGICTDRFEVNSKGWYTYQGKLVVATAVERYVRLSRYERKDHINYRNIYDELDIMIDNVWYEAIVLDICGKCHDEPRIDLFVKENGIDRKEVYVWNTIKKYKQ